MSGLKFKNGLSVDECGEHGELLTIRGSMKKESIGYAKAKQIVDSLEDDGVLVDTGKGYQLALVDENQQSLNYV